MIPRLTSYGPCRWPLPVTVMSDKDKNWPVRVSPARTAKPTLQAGA